jgi:hypothetical protein
VSGPGRTEPTPEQETVLCCARSEIPPDLAERLRALVGRPELDWDAVTAIAERHRVLALVVHHLRACAPNLLPPAVDARLGGWFLDNTQATLRVMHETLALVSHLEAGGVACIPFKGPTLAATLYGEPNLRMVGDLDLIVRESDVDAAALLAADLGYRPKLALGPRRHRRLLRDGHHLEMVRGDGLLAELHWTIAKRAFAFPVDMTAVWSRATTVIHGRHRWRALAGEDLLVVLAIQGSKEGWQSLERIASVAETARTLGPEEWRTARASAAAWGAGRALLVGLLLGERLLGADLPPEAAAWTADDPRAGAVADAVAQRLFRPTRAWEALGYHLAVREGIGAKAAFLAASAFTSGPEEWEFADLPAPLEWAYPLVRPVRLLAKYGRGGGGRRAR